MRSRALAPSRILLRQALDAREIRAGDRHGLSGAGVSCWGRRRCWRRSSRPERDAARRELVEYDPEREQVGARVGRLAPHLLGSHVRQGAHHLPRRGDRREARRRRGGIDLGFAAGEPCEPEVEHLDSTVARQHHVRGFEVAMNDVLFVSRRECLRDGKAQRDHPLGR
jgi:hypothetical protein